MLNVGLHGAFNLVDAGTQKLYLGDILKSSIKRRGKKKKECYSKSIPRLKRGSSVEDQVEVILKLHIAYPRKWNIVCLFCYIEFQYLIFMGEC